MGLPRYVSDKEKYDIKMFGYALLSYCDQTFKDSGRAYADILKNDRITEKGSYNLSYGYKIRKRIRNAYKLNGCKHKPTNFYFKVAYDCGINREKRTIGMFTYDSVYRRYDFDTYEVPTGYTMSRVEDKSYYLLIKNTVIKKEERLEHLLNLFTDIFKKHSYIRKVYESRTFPSKLRNLIFNRDNFKCKVCNKHKDQLPENIFLEVDHIIEWQDGGETMYSNGQTICSDCNKGKHHAKKYLKLAV